MKKIVSTTFFGLACAMGVFAQGTILLDNTANTGVFGGFGGVAYDAANNNGGTVYSASVTKNGLIFTTDPAAAGTVVGGPAGSQLIGVDYNYAFFAGSSAGTVTTLISGTTGNPTSGINATYGGIQLPSGTPFTLTAAGIASGGTGFFLLQVWEGNFASYSAAVAANAYAGQSAIWSQTTGGGANPPSKLTGMGDILLTNTAAPIPEPSTLALAGLGGFGMLMAMRRKKA
jgi:hypothetical protein